MKSKGRQKEKKKGSARVSDRAKIVAAVAPDSFPKRACKCQSPFSLLRFGSSSILHFPLPDHGGRKGPWHCVGAWLAGTGICPPPHPCRGGLGQKPGGRRVRDMPAMVRCCQVRIPVCQYLSHTHHRPANSLKHIEPPIFPELFHAPLHVFVNHARSPQSCERQRGSLYYVAIADLREKASPRNRINTVSLKLPCPETTSSPRHPSTKTRPFTVFSTSDQQDTMVAMSLAVGQTLSSRELDVGQPRDGRHAADSFNLDSLPNTAAGRQDEPTTTTTASPTKRSSYDSMQSSLYDAMADHEMIRPKPDQQQHVADESGPAPVLPQKSALRASRLLDDLVGLKMATAPAQPAAFTQDPHDEYLSSEEEASSTAGDFSDFEYDSSSDDIAPSPVKECNGREVTARVVSVIFSGKPVVVDVPQVRRSISPNSIERPKSATALSHKGSYDAEVKSRRTSVSTVSSRSSRSSNPKPQRMHPPRSSSMQPLGGAERAKPFFLKIDPYANGSTYSLDTQQQKQQQQQQHQQEEPQESRERRLGEDDRPKTPRTPTKMFKGVARAMSLMKRRSLPRLNQAYLSASSEHLPQPISPSNSSIPEEPIEQPQPAPKEEATQEHTEMRPTRPATATPPPLSHPPPCPQLQPLTHDEIVRIAARNEKMAKHLSVARTFHEGQTLESPISPISPLSGHSPNTAPSSSSGSGSGKRTSTFGFARRRMSVKLTGGKFQL